MENKPKRIARTKIGDYTVNTVEIGDSYETAIKLEDRNYIIVQRYDTETRARIGHKHWVGICGDKPLYAIDVTDNTQKLF